jgi:site-specific DNA-cytosine methylase
VPDHDVAVAGLPCMSFSVLGWKRGLAAPRSNVFHPVLRVVAARKSRVVILENVPALAVHAADSTLKFYLNCIRGLGFTVTWSRVMIPFFAQHPYARLRVLSRCADFDNVLDLDHRCHTVLCWSLNPPAVRKDYELITPPVEDRLAAMRKCAGAGYPIRVRLMPIIPDWQRTTTSCWSRCCRR